jgi:hypothetical protein
MGAVYRAEDPRLNRQIALKVLLPELSTNERARARFRHEARAQARVEHDHIIPIYDVGEANGVAYIAMPLLKGQTLESALKQNPRPPLAEALRIGREVTAGLAAAHAAGLVHRDIKPGNVWLEGPNRRVKILDFGLARSEPDAPGDRSPVTGVGAIVGTPAYMSPEQARSRPADHRSDLFSLGVVLYELTTGRKPFTGASAFDVMAAVVGHDPPAAHAVAPDLPPALSDLTRRMMAKDPAARPPTAEAVATELDAIERGLTVPPVRVIPLGTVPGAPDPWADLDTTHTDAPGPSPRAETPRRAARWLWPAGCALGAVLVVLVALAVNAIKPKEKQEPVADAKKKNGGKVTGPVPSGGLVFDGATVVTVPTLNLEGQRPITLEAWVTPNALDQSFVIGGPSVGLGFAGNSLGAGFIDGANAFKVDGRARLTTGQKIHAAFVVPKDGDRFVLFVDGGEAGTNVEKLPALPALPASRSRTLIGRSPRPGLDQPFRGTIHALRVSRTPRYDKNFEPPARFDPDPNTLALYRFDEGGGPVLTDHSGNKHHGTIEGGTWVPPAK